MSSSPINGKNDRSTSTDKASEGRRFSVPVLLTVVVIALLIIFVKGCNDGAANKEVDVADSAEAVPAAQTSMPARESLKVKLPDGTELDAFKGGIEDQLVGFLNDPASRPGNNVWFDFDNLNFETGSAQLTTESMSQVQHIAAILAAYPKLKIKIGGYTDKTGDSLTNSKLSQSRAESVLVALKAAKANPTQLTGAEGYGSQFAKAPADAPDEARKSDRRISVGVREK